MSNSKEVIDNIRAEIIVANTNICNLKSLLKTEIDNFQKNCQHSKYRAIHNGDYHSSGYYYICKNCELLESKRPDTLKIEFE